MMEKDVKSQEKQSESESDSSKETIRSDDIYRLPPEIWDAIFDNLLDPHDILNVSQTAPYWEDVLYSTRSSWLFSPVFSLLLEYLSKRDILECRRTCKRWCYGVDHFLENNAYHRPATEEEMRRKNKNIMRTKYYKTDQRIRPLVLSLNKKHLTYNMMKQAKREKLLKEASNHPRCPIVGRSVCVMELPRETPPSNAQFLQVFGQHIWFLKIGMGNLPPVENLACILQLISHSSNLKKLDIYGAIVPPPGPTDQIESVAADTEQQLSNVFTRITEEDKQRFPKLETLDVEMIGMCHAKIKEILLTLFCNRNLQSLAVNLMSITANLDMSNLTDLSVSMYSDIQLSSLLHCRAPLRRLCLYLCGTVTASLAFKVVRHFEATLRNFGLQLSPEYYTSPLYLIDLSLRLSLFKVNGSLHCPHLKRTSLKGCRPPSFNFLCGLHNSLEYLHIYIDNIEHWEGWLQRNSKTVQEYHEELDLLELLKQLNSSNKLKMYKSNVWRIFPRLKVFTVVLWNDGDTIEEDKKVEWQFRRDIYENMQRSIKH